MLDCFVKSYKNFLNVAKRLLLTKFFWYDGVMGRATIHRSPLEVLLIVFLIHLRNLTIALLSFLAFFSQSLHSHGENALIFLKCHPSRWNIDFMFSGE